MNTPSLILILFLAWGNTAIASGTRKDSIAPEISKTPIQPQLPSFEFKGLLLGSSENTLKERFTDFVCRDPKDDRQRRMADRVCTAAPSITCRPNTWCENDPDKPWVYAGLRAKFLTALFYADQLHSISVNIHSDQFDQVSRALIVKYGAPTSQETNILQTRAGAKYENQKLIWERSESALSIEKYVNSIDSSSVRYTLKNAIQEHRRRSIKNTEDAAKQL